MEFTGYSALWKAIIRPPRAIYSSDDLGPKKFIVKDPMGEAFKV